MSNRKQSFEFDHLFFFSFSSLTESSQQCYIGGNSPADPMSDDEEENHHHHHHRRINIEHGRSPHSDETVNRSNSLSPLPLIITNGVDDLPTTTPVAVKVEQENEFNSSSPPSPSIQPIPNKMSVTTSLPGSSSASKRLTGTLNRLLNSVINRPNGHHYHNGVSSSPSASSSATTIIDSTSKEPKISMEMSTQSIESMKLNSCVLFLIMKKFFSSFCPTFR